MPRLLVFQQVLVNRVKRTDLLLALWDVPEHFEMETLTCIWEQGQAARWPC